MKLFYTLFLASVSYVLMAQEFQNNVKPLELVINQNPATFESQTFEPFLKTNQKNSVVAELEQNRSLYSVLDLDKSILNAISKNAPQSFRMKLPNLKNKESLELDLVQVDIFSSDFEVTRGSDGQAVDVNRGLHYRGVVKGDSRSVVAISIFKDEVMGIISNDDGNLVLGKLKGTNWSDEHVLYNDKDVLQDHHFECATEDDGIGYKPKDLEYNNQKSPGDCIKLYIEADYDIFQDKGSVSATSNYITGLMNEVITLYANESIVAVVSQLVVWDVVSPYSSTSSSGMLSDFQANLGTFNGDLAQLFSYQASGGIAAGFSGICNPNPDNSMCFSSINSSYAVVPTYSWSVMVATHEFGHLWGSRHTHACVWNGNNTAIDGCYTTEGSCSSPPIPQNGGTIMSYCHLQSVGINFNNGFGPQPGNVIRNSVDNASCTTACGPPSCNDGIQNQDETGVDCGGTICSPCPTCSDGIQNGEELGVDCGGPDCAPCPCTGQDVTLTIVLDNYPGETTWTITSGGLTYASGGPYAGAGSTVTEINCLNDGCYDFNIFDSYGDGICCAYGNGSYSLEDASGNILASGGSFGSSETTNFCLSTTPALSVSIASQSNVSCNGGSDGSATASVSDGTAPYTYAWSNGGSGATVNGLSAGSYTVTATDSNSSTGTASVTITEPSAINLSVSGTDESCTGAGDGTATANATGGSGGFNYSWSGPGGYTATGSNISNLSSGVYSVTATDSNGCAENDAVTINETTAGSSCDDGDPCTTNDVYDASCNCAGTFQDSDGDGVCDANDVCPGYDDTQDADGDGIPDGCDTNNCTPVTANFPDDPLTHSGNGSSSTTLSFSSLHQDASFTITGLNAVTNGPPSQRYIDQAVVTYDDGSGSSVTVGTYSGTGGSSASVSITGDIVSITVTLQDGYDGNAPGTLSINLGDVSACDTGASCPDDDNDGVCNSNDVCPGYDDTQDSDGDGIPDGCDSNNCTVTTDNFAVNPLTHSGSGSSSTTLNFGANHEDASFTISGLDAVTNGNPNNRYIESVTVTYVDGNGNTQTEGTYNGNNTNSANVNISGEVSSITVTLEDGYDGNAPGTLSVNLGTVSSCLPSGALVEEEKIRSDETIMNLYPNPASNILNLNIDLVQDSDIKLRIVNLNGKLMWRTNKSLRGGNQNMDLDIQGLNSGVYLFQMELDNKLYSEKLVIIK